MPGHFNSPNWAPVRGLGARRAFRPRKRGGRRVQRQRQLRNQQLADSFVQNNAAPQFYGHTNFVNNATNDVQFYQPQPQFYQQQQIDTPHYHVDNAFVQQPVVQNQFIAPTQHVNQFHGNHCPNYGNVRQRSQQFALSTIRFRPAVAHNPALAPLTLTLPRRTTLTMVLGASHIRRMNEMLIDRNISNFDLPPHAHEVIVYGLGGMGYIQENPAKNIISKLPFIDNTRPELLILQLGSNDVSEFSPQDIVDSMMEIVKFALQSGVRRVILGALWQREDEGYNFAMERVNSYLSYRISHLQDIRVQFWKHRGLSEPQYDMLIDGTHLSTYYYWKLFRSLRGAIVFHSRRLPRIDA